MNGTVKAVISTIQGRVGQAIIMAANPFRGESSPLGRGSFKRCFTLIELLIGFSLLTSIGGLIGWRVGPLIQKNQFSNDVARLKNELVSLHQLAVTTQSDWSLAIERKGSGWTLKEECTKTPRLCAKHLKPIKSASLIFNDKAIDQIIFTFYATGLVLPEGTITCTQNRIEKTEMLSLSQLFQQERQ